MEAPKAERIKKELTAFSDTRIDDYYWLANRQDERVLKLLNSENEYYAENIESYKPLIETIYGEIVSTIVEDVRTVPVKIKDWVYLVRYEKNLQYPIYTRKPFIGDISMRIPTPGEGMDVDEIELLDVNKISKDYEFFNLGDLQISIDSNTMAYSYDTDGSETYNAKIIDLKNDNEIDQLLNIYSTLVWHKDNKHIYYLKLDEEMRPFQVWCHTIGQDQQNDLLIYEEQDDAYFVDISSTKDDRYIIISSNSKITSDVHLINSDIGFTEIYRFTDKVNGHEYHVEHLGNRFYIVTNLNAVNFKVMSCGEDSTGMNSWVELTEHQENVRVESLETFKDHLVISKRSNADTYFEIIDLSTQQRHEFKGSKEFSTVYLNVNPDIDAVTLRYSEQSLKYPEAIYELNLIDKSTKLLWQRPFNNFNPEDYATNRYFAVSKDGTEIPYTIIYKLGSDTADRPCLLYAYGAYEISLDPWFSPSRLSLLNRGYIFAVAHARGGGENGRLWYENGKRNNKMNTFYDVIAVASDLIDKDLTSATRLALRGGSAGGLTVGAVINMAGELFKAAIAEVPFVDTLTTMSDPDLPLTVTEWDEWGNPLENSEDYFYIKNYSPYDNIKEDVDYPKILATAGLNDPRVGYFEPAKWVQKLRYLNPRSQVLLKVELGAGHQGPSGRYNEYEEEAEVLAFLLTSLSERKDLR